MTPLILGPDLYKLHAELWEGTERLAARSTVFKVTAERALIGGKPALHVPIYLSVKPAA